MNDNFRFARNLVGETLCKLIAEDLSSGTEVEVLAGEQDAKRRKTIVLNKPTQDPVTGIRYKTNDVSKAQWRVSLEDVPSTPSYRSQAMTMMAEVLKGLPPEMQATLMPNFIEMTELPKRKELAAQLRAQMGQTDGNGNDVDPAVAQMQQQMQQMQQMMQQGQQQYEGQIQQLQQQLLDANAKNREASLLLKDREADAQLRLLDHDQKMSESNRIAQHEADQAEKETVRLNLENAKLQLEREKMLMDDGKHQREIQARKQESQATFETAALAPQPPERDEAAEMAKLGKMIEAMIKPLMTNVEGVAKEVEGLKQAPVEKPAPAVAPIINLTVDAASGKVKKSIVVKRDAAGNMTGADVVES